jgi:hypothetical protein
MSFNLPQYLQYKLSEVLRPRLPELYFDNGMYCPQIADLPEGAQYLSAEIVTQYGEAAIAANEAMDIPVGDITVGQETYKVVYVVGQIKYSDPELKAAKFAMENGQLVTNLQDERLFTLRRMIESKSHNLCAYGSNSHGIYGFLNHPDVPLSASSTYRVYAQNADPKIILDFVNSEIDAITTETEMVETPDTIGLPPRLYNLLKNTYRNTQTDTTLLKSIMDTNPLIKQIIRLPELASARLLANGVHASGTTKDRMIIYNLNPSNVKRHYNNLYLMPPQMNGINHTVIGYKGMSSVRFPYPKTARYVDFPISTTNN